MQSNLKLKSEINSTNQRIREIDYQLKLRESELSDLKEAYKEKIRKCDAWEKVK
jgi:hypothetical protein